MRVLTYTHNEYHVMFEWYLALKTSIDDKDSKIFRDTLDSLTDEQKLKLMSQLKESQKQQSPDTAAGGAAADGYDESINSVLTQCEQGEYILKLL